MPASSYADVVISGGGQDISVPVTPDGSSAVISVVPQSFAGDCVMFQGSFIRIQQPINGDSQIEVWTDTYTTHTNHADIWWNTFQFRTSSGTLLYTSPTVRSVDMTQINTLYTTHQFFEMHIDPALYPQIGEIHWSGTC
jgi:hypothetical protein